MGKDELNPEKVYLPIEVEKVIELVKDSNIVYIFQVEVGSMSSHHAHAYLLKLEELVNAKGITNCIFTQTRNNVGVIKAIKIEKPQDVELNSVITGE